MKRISWGGDLIAGEIKIYFPKKSKLRPLPNAGQMSPEDTFRVDLINLPAKPLHKPINSKWRVPQNGKRSIACPSPPSFMLQVLNTTSYVKREKHLHDFSCARHM